MTASPARYPDVARPDAATVLISRRHLGSRERLRAAVDRSAAAWGSGPWPAGLLSVSFFTGTEDESLLAYAQWTDDTAYGRFARDRGAGLLRGVDAEQDAGRSAPVGFRLYRSTGPGREGRVPGCIAVPTFDVDGPERQRSIVDALVEGPLGGPLPGLMAAHFHLSTDGSRVVNYAEWSTEELHERALGGPVLRAAGVVTRRMPGVRGVDCRRYRLSRSLTAPAGMPG